MGSKIQTQHLHLGNTIPGLGYAYVKKEKRLNGKKKLQKHTFLTNSITDLYFLTSKSELRSEGNTAQLLPH